MRQTLVASLVIACLSLARAASAHEFWISPEAYAVQPDAPIVAHLRVGSDFVGTPMSYFPSRFERFEVRMGERVVEVEGRLGDLPAMTLPAPGEGLAVVVHETKGDTLRYRTRALFEQFVAHKDLAGVLERHAARGLPELAFREAYTRYAKSLIRVGDGAGSDTRVGLRIELVAEANPYTDDLTEGFPVRLYHDGAPRPDTQIEVYSRAPAAAGGEVSVVRLRSDAEGRLVVPVAPGTEYMVDSVVMEDTGNDDPEAGPVWHSAWANLTFRTPG